MINLLSPKSENNLVSKNDPINIFENNAATRSTQQIENSEQNSILHTEAEPDFLTMKSHRHLNDEHLNRAGSSNDVDLLTLLNDEIPENLFHRNKSAPNFAFSTEQKAADDIFAEILSLPRGNKNSKDLPNV